MALWRRDHADRSVASGLIHHSDAGSQGGFNWSSQHLDFEELRWLVVSDDGRIGRAGLRCGRRSAANGTAGASAAVLGGDR
ncbi:MAG: hypothetical protein JWR32_459 [Mycobacterium sp.]|jgi:hypothetical protein|nr:hypothetical protein [Mycobacterium sp.]